MKAAVALVFGMVVMGLLSQAESKKCKDESKVEKAYEDCLERGAHKSEKGKEKSLEEKCAEKSKKACGGSLPDGLKKAMDKVNEMFEGLVGENSDMAKIGDMLKKKLGGGDIQKAIKGFLKMDD